MDREKKVFLCVKSLLNIAIDLKDEYKDFSDMILFISDKIAQQEQARELKTYQIHGQGKHHDLSSDCSCDNEDCACELKIQEEDDIEFEVDEMIRTVRKELNVPDKQ